MLMFHVGVFQLKVIMIHMVGLPFYEAALFILFSILQDHIGFILLSCAALKISI